MFEGFNVVRIDGEQVILTPSSTYSVRFERPENDLKDQCFIYVSGSTCLALSLKLDKVRGYVLEGGGYARDLTIPESGSEVDTGLYTFAEIGIDIKPLLGADRCAVRTYCRNTGEATTYLISSDRVLELTSIGNIGVNIRVFDGINPEK